MFNLQSKTFSQINIEEAFLVKIKEIKEKFIFK